MSSSWHNLHKSLGKAIAIMGDDVCGNKPNLICIRRGSDLNKMFAYSILLSLIAGVVFVAKEGMR